MFQSVLVYRLSVEQGAHHIMTQGILHLFKQPLTLSAILYQRIPLADVAQAWDRSGPRVVLVPQG